MKKKVLVIRFSSIGDIIQCMSIIEPVKFQLEAELHWVCRKDFSQMLSTNPNIDKIWSFDKKTGFKGLVKIISLLRKEKYDYIYDAHQNIRSTIIKVLMGMVWYNPKIKLAIRSKQYLRRFCFFRLKIKSALEMPFRAVKSFQKPLLKWGIDFSKQYNTDWQFASDVIEKGKELVGDALENNKCITIVPSAAWELKRWPISYWKQLVQKMPDYLFIIIAGPDDTFTQEIEAVAKERIINLSGKTSLQESFYVISKSHFVISADTGFLHAADLFKIKAIALMGPTAFGHPSGETVTVLERNELTCRPCTKAGDTKCKLVGNYRACLLDITPDLVIKTVEETF